WGNRRWRIDRCFLHGRRRERGFDQWCSNRWSCNHWSSTGGTSGSVATSGAGAGGTAGSADPCRPEQADYYVAVDGNDSNPGTIDQPSDGGQGSRDEKQHRVSQRQRLYRRIWGRLAIQLVGPRTDAIGGRLPECLGRGLHGPKTPGRKP